MGYGQILKVFCKGVVKKNHIYTKKIPDYLPGISFNEILKKIQNNEKMYSKFYLV
jgi:hypothetical protein